MRHNNIFHSHSLLDWTTGHQDHDNTLFGIGSNNVVEWKGIWDGNPPLKLVRHYPNSWMDCYRKIFLSLCMLIVRYKGQWPKQCDCCVIHSWNCEWRIISSLWTVITAVFVMITGYF